MLVNKRGMHTLYDDKTTVLSVMVRNNHLGRNIFNFSLECRSELFPADTRPRVLRLSALELDEKLAVARPCFSVSATVHRKQILAYRVAEQYLFKKEVRAVEYAVVTPDLETQKKIIASKEFTSNFLRQFSLVPPMNAGLLTNLDVLKRDGHSWKAFIADTDDEALKGASRLVPIGTQAYIVLSRQVKRPDGELVGLFTAGSSDQRSRQAGRTEAAASAAGARQGRTGSGNEGVVSSSRHPWRRLI